MKYFFYAVLGLAALVGLAYIVKNRKKQSKGPAVIDLTNAREEVTEGTLNFSDVAGLFKQQHLNKEEDTPFICTGAVEGTLAFTPAEKLTKPGYKLLLLGSFNNKTDEARVFTVVYCKDFDEKTKETLGNEPLVRLS